MTSKEQVTKAQRQILELLASYEEVIAALYTTFAKHLPDYKEFWQHLAKEEVGHAQLLRGLNKFLDRGFLFKDIGRFDIAEIQAKILEVNSLLQVVKSNSITAEDAIAIALKAESGILDGPFYKIVTSDAPEFRIIAKHLSDATERHANDVSDLFIALHPNSPKAKHHRRK
ncbi:MAG: hypothetical protein WCN95_11825 [bacterium]